MDPWGSSSSASGCDLIVNDGFPDNYISIHIDLPNLDLYDIWDIAATFFHESLHLFQRCSGCECLCDHARIQRREEAFWRAVAEKLGNDPRARAYANRKGDRAGARATENELYALKKCGC